LLKILFIHEVSYRKKVIFEMHEFPELLALRGHEISFLEFDEGRKFWQKGQAPRSEMIRGRVRPDARINLSRPFQFGIPGVDRVLALITVLPTLRKIFKNNNFDAVVLYAVPTYGLQTLWLARRFKVPVLFRALDVSHKIRSSLLSLAIKWVEKLIYKQVGLLSANNPAMADYCKELGKRTKATLVHYPPLDLIHFQKGKRDQSLRQSLGFKDDDHVIVYMGSFFYFSGLKPALTKFAHLAANNRNFKFLLIGGGEQDSDLRRLIVDLGIQDQVVFTGFIGYRELPGYLRVADVAVNTLEPTLVANVAFPNKVLQYMAAGLPVVSTKLDGLFSVLQNQKGITWADDASTVIREAFQLKDNGIAGGRTAILDANKSVLSPFESEITIRLFETSLTTLSHGGNQ
jgi:glycosyltransferase involved in cell wall biosynthesis